jgi:hypothetical protein
LSGEQKQSGGPPRCFENSILLQLQQVRRRPMLLRGPSSTAVVLTRVPKVAALPSHLQAAPPRTTQAPLPCIQASIRCPTTFWAAASGTLSAAAEATAYASARATGIIRVICASASPIIAGGDNMNAIYWFLRYPPFPRLSLDFSRFSPLGISAATAPALRTTAGRMLMCKNFQRVMTAQFGSF